MPGRITELATALLALSLGLAAPAAAQPSAKSAARPLVVVDAGHGGVDPGARGPGGTLEKHVTLAVARQVAALLREETNYEVRLTRERDTLIALRDRPRLANRWKDAGQPALFLSIHCNAHPERSARGFETFFLSEAKTEDARRVAEMENAAQRYEADASSSAADPLGFILNDLRQNHYLRESSTWADVVQTRLGRVLDAPDRGVKQAGFMVLNGAFMPAVLVEIGFITHPQEEKLLADRAHQQRIARQLVRAVRDYFASTLPSARTASRR